MSVPATFVIAPGFRPDQRQTALDLFWQGFSAKLNPIMGPKDKAMAFLDLVADPGHAIGAVAPDGRLIGFAGFKTEHGAFVGGDLKELCAIYGWFGGLWRAVPLALFDRALEPNTLLMDGIVVDETVRGQGVGTALLNAIKSEAGARGCKRVRLDVIDINPRARALYEKQGFVAGKTHHIGPLRHLFGFRMATTMIYDL